MDDLVRTGSGKLFVRSSADFRKVGRRLALGSLGLALVLLVVIAAADTDLSGLLVMPAIPGVVGAVFAVIGRQTLFDLNARVIRQSGRAPLGFDDVAAIATWKTTTEFEVEGATNYVVRYHLGLCDREGAGTAWSDIDGLRTRMDAICGEPRRPLGDDERSELRSAQDSLAESVDLEGPNLAHHGDELVVWRAAEKLARVLDKPLIDHCGDRMLFRTPATLDMSVAEALGRHLRTPEPPGPPPATIEVTSAPPTVAWHRDMKSELKVVYGFSAVTAIISVVLAFTVHLNALILLSLPVLLLGGMMHRARGHGWYELRIGAESVEVRPRGRDRARHTVSLSELEDLRVSRMPDAADMTTLNLVTDTGVVRLPMTHEQASWVKDWVETVLSDRQPG